MERFARGLATALMFGFPAATAYGQASIPGGTIPFGPVTGFSVVLNDWPPRLSLVDHRSRSVTGVLATHRLDTVAALNVELSPGGRAAYVLHVDNSITRLDLTVAAPEPETISPPPSSIFPGFIQTMRDLEISGDGRYLVATALNVGAWQFGIPLPRNRISIYDLANGSSTHFTLDTVLNDLFLPELEITIDSSNRAYVTDGDFQSVVVVDLATATVLGTHKGSDNESISIPIGGTGSGPALPCGAIGMSKFGPGWIAFETGAGHGFLRRPGPTFGTHVDLDYPGPDFRELEARADSRYIAFSRPKSMSLSQTAVDRIAIVDLVTGASCITAQVTGTRRFREIEFFRDGGNHKVYGIDFGSNTFLVADFTPWVANPSLPNVTLSMTPIPKPTFRFRQGSDGLLADFGEYIVHDAEGRLAFFSIDPPAVLDTVDTHLFHGPRRSVDLEISTSVRNHQD